jgi:hypothetical protein
MKFKIILIFILALLISTATYAVSPITGLRVIGNAPFNQNYQPNSAGFIYSNYSRIAWDAVPGAISYKVRFSNKQYPGTYDRKEEFQTTNNSNFDCTPYYLSVEPNWWGYVTVVAVTATGDLERSNPILINYSGTSADLIQSSDLSAGSVVDGVQYTLKLKTGFKFIATKYNSYIGFSSVDNRVLVLLRAKHQKDSIDAAAQISQSPEVLTALDNTAQISNACFPNPTHGEFIVRMNLPKDKTVEIKVYDNFSRLVKTAITNVSETTISIAGEQAGVYFVRYSIDGKNYNYKVVKL